MQPNRYNLNSITYHKRKERMKTKEELIKMTPVYLGNWENAENCIYDFEGVVWEDGITKQKTLDKHKGENILFAYYSYEDYSGEAYVLFEKEGELYEVFGSHCSCYGLEGQWEPEKVVLKEKEKTLYTGFDRGYSQDLRNFLK